MLVSRSKFRGFSDIALVPEITFKNHDAYNDFIKGVTLRGTAGTWSGVSSGILSVLNSAITNVVGIAGQTKLAEFQTKAQSIVGRLDQLQTYGLGGRSEGQDSQYKGAMTQLKNLIMEYAQKITNANKEDVASGSYTPTVQTQALTSSGGSQRQTTSTSAPASSPWKWPLIIGGSVVGLAAIGGTSFFLLKKKKSPAAAVAGYRRSRR